MAVTSKVSLLTVIIFTIICTEHMVAQSYSEYAAQADAFMDSEEYEQAIEAWTKAIELNPKYNSAYGNRGIAKARLHDLTGAIMDFDKAIELKDEIEAEVTEDLLEGFLYWKGATYYNRGLAKQELGQLDQAILDFQEAMELNHKPENCMKRIAECEKLMKEKK